MKFGGRMRHDGTEDFECLLCLDQGRLSVLRQAAVEQYRATGVIDVRLLGSWPTGSVECTCRRGKALSRDGTLGCTYDERRMFRVQGGDQGVKREGFLDELASWLNQPREPEYPWG